MAAEKLPLRRRDFTMGTAKAKSDDDDVTSQLSIVESVASRIAIKTEVACHLVEQIRAEAEQLLADHGIDLKKREPDITDDQVQGLLKEDPADESDEK